MRNLLDAFLYLSIGARATVIAGFALLMWWIFAGLAVRILSVIPWLLLKLFHGLYKLLDIPISVLHKTFGSTFEWLDRGLTTGTEKACGFLDNLYKRMKTPKTVWRGKAFLVFLVLAAYFLIPVLANLTDRPFVFWQDGFLEREASVIVWIEEREWIDYEPDEITLTETIEEEEEQDGIRVVIDGVRQSFVVAPQIIRGNTMLPLSCFAESLGMYVHFDYDINTAIITIDEILISHVVETAEISINDEVTTIVAPSLIIEDVVFVPVRMLTEIIGAYVEWEQETQTVTINRH